MKWILVEWEGPECETLQECGGSDQWELNLEQSIWVRDTCSWSVESQGGNSSAQFSCSDISDCLWPHRLQHARLTCPSPTYMSLFKLMSIQSMMSPNHFILCHPFLLLSSIPPSIRVFPNESTLPIRWPKCWSFSFSISPSNEYLGQISLKIDWFNLFCSPRDSQESSPTPQVKSISSSVLSFFIFQVSYPYMTTEKTVLTRWNFFGKVMSLLFNMPSRFGHIFSSKNQASFHFMAAPSAVILETKKTNPVTGSIDSPSVCHEVMDQMPWSYFFECWVLSHHFHSPLTFIRGSSVLHFMP